MLRSFTIVLDGAPACHYPRSAHEHMAALVRDYGFSLLGSYMWVLDEDARGEDAESIVRAAIRVANSYNATNGALNDALQALVGVGIPERIATAIIDECLTETLVEPTPDDLATLMRARSRHIDAALREAAARLDTLPDGGTEAQADAEVARIMATFSPKGVIDEGVRGEDLWFVWAHDMWSFDQRMHALVCRRPHAGALRCKRLDTPDHGVAQSPTIVMSDDNYRDGTGLYGYHAEVI